MGWSSKNTLSYSELRKAIRKKSMKCVALDCDRQAVSIHHMDGNHSNNEPSNLAPACQLCHDEEHGITAEINDLKLLTREFYEIQKYRKSLANRIRAYERLDIPLDYCPKGFADIVALEKKLKGHIQALLKSNTFYNAWLRKVKGIGPLLGASLLAELGSPERFQTVGQLWAYCGLHVNDDGEAPRRKRGQKASWNGILRTSLFKVATSFLKYDCFGRKLYDEYKGYYLERDGPEPAWQPHRRALRKVEKDFIRCVWRAWLKACNLPVSKPHTDTKVFERDWIV